MADETEDLEKEGLETSPLSLSDEDFENFSLEDLDDEKTLEESETDNTNESDNTDESDEKTDDLERAFGRHQDKDLILIDTSGQSQKNKEQLIKLKTFLNVLSDVEVHLLLSATTSTETMDNIIQNFRFLSVDRLLFTKIDEGFIFGNILNVVSKYKIPVSYLTLGQNVPQDIEVANARKIAWLILYPEQKI